MKRIVEWVKISFPEYRERYLFTAKMRLVFFLGFFCLYLYFYRYVLNQTKIISALIVSLFLIGILLYKNVLKGRFVPFLVTSEFIIDLLLITLIVYLSGGPHSSYFTIYIFYALIAGIFYNHYLTAILGILSTVFFGVFLLLCKWGIIPPLILDYGDRLEIPGYTPFAHYAFTLIFTLLVFYAVKMASSFSQRRERQLELRNKELTALNLMSSTIRSVEAFKKVIDQVLTGIIEGLGLKTALILVSDHEEGIVRIYTRRKHPQIDMIEKLLGRSADELTLPIEILNMELFKEVMNRKTIFRSGLDELAAGLEGYFSQENLRQIQQILEADRMVVVPLIAGEKVIGAIIGFFKGKFVEGELVNTLEAFTNQTALSLEAASTIEKLKKANLELQRANRVKSEFLATMSHELRTPLTAIIGYTELMLEGMMGDFSTEQHDGLRDVLHNAEELLEMINSLLDLTRIDSGKMPLDKRKFDVRELTERLGRRIAPLLHQKSQIFEIDVPTDLGPVYADEMKLQQVILNLLSNANKFTLDGGTIKVSVRSFANLSSYPKNDRLGTRFEMDKPIVEIEVSDTGIGIPPNELEPIFNMFHQVDSGMTRKFRGTGLGLALARKMVELHRGVIWAESELGKGSSFIIVIPM